jgi:uncharacterized protein YlxW (UPF0749 family)
MGKMRDFLSMTQRERVGAIVVLVLLACSLAAIFAVRQCQRVEPGADSAEMQQLVSERDSLRAAQDSLKAVIKRPDKRSKLKVIDEKQRVDGDIKQRKAGEVKKVKADEVKKIKSGNVKQRKAVDKSPAQREMKEMDRY